MASAQGRTDRHQPDPGLGLRGMDERTKLLRGTLKIRSQPGKGTELALDVPLPSTEATEGMLDSAPTRPPEVVARG